MQSIDLNADLGEGYGPWTKGNDAALLKLLSSANVACGGHASDPETMFLTLSLAKENGVTVGAHPGYPDKEGFGRRRLPCTLAEIERFVAAQIGALIGVGALAGVKVRYVKAHGALANLASEERDVADAIARAVRAIDRDMPLLAIAGTQLEDAGRGAGLAVFSEVFADRAYMPSGHLVSRSRPDALIEDADFAAQRLLKFLETGRMPTVDGGEVALPAHSICVHGDNAHAVDVAGQIRRALEAAGVAIKAFVPA